ncbi:unnamed protein product [Closterium sp. NIES-65]|nr:unnamed protein product [Closterium sp. NIES-65]
MSPAMPHSSTLCKHPSLSFHCISVCLFPCPCHRRNISNNGLSGAIPESLTAITSLAYLNMSFNHFEGTIPPSLGGLRQLTTVDTNDTSLKCPDNYTSCGVPQDTSSGFCRACPDFCNTSPTSHVAAVSLDLFIATVIAAPLPVTSSLATPVATTFLPALCPFENSQGLFLQPGESDGHKRPPQPREAAVSIGITDKTRVEQILIYELMPNGDLSHWIGKGMPPHPVGRPEAVSPLSFERRVQQQLAQSGSRAVVAWLKQTRMEARDDLVLTVVQLALRCTSKQSAPRPAMGVIAAELEAVLVALGGAHRNAGARQVDEEVELQRPDVDLDAEIARHSLL